MNAFRANNVTVWVSSPDTHSERKLDADLSIAALKLKFEPITGISSDDQVLSLLRTDGGEFICQLSEDQRSLASYGVADWMCIKIANSDPNASSAGAYSDASNVQKFELTEQEYESRTDTVQSYLKRNKLGPKFAPSDPFSTPPPAPPALAEGINVGDRCEVSSVGGMAARGEVKFVGETAFGKGKNAGVWVGVELDEPVGKNDGSVDGERYFPSKKNHGIFVRPDRVQVGDFPEESIFDDDEEM